MTSQPKLPEKISILGATGSIGRNTLSVLEHLGGRECFNVVALTGKSNIELLCEQAKIFTPEIVVTADETRYAELKQGLSGTGIEVAAGSEALIEAGKRQSDWVMAGIVGMAGLAPTLAAAERGADIALANKECLVSAGQLFKSIIKNAGGQLLPADSEHSAIFQVLSEHQMSAVERIILTASGGPYLNYSIEEMANVTPQNAASHPRWAMGQKISIDSASMFNKALEMIEAMHLFDVSPDKIEVVVHPQSIVHSLVAYEDGSVLAQLGVPDMRTALGYTLTHPHRAHLPVERLDLVKLSRLDFQAPDDKRFPALQLARDAMKTGGLSGAVLNGSKEAALDAFITGRIGFLQMAEIVEKVMNDMAKETQDTPTIDAICDSDKVARIKAGEFVNNLA